MGGQSSCSDVPPPTVVGADACVETGADTLAWAGLEAAGSISAAGPMLGAGVASGLVSDCGAGISSSESSAACSASDCDWSSVAGSAVAGTPVTGSAASRGDSSCTGCTGPSGVISVATSVAGSAASSVASSVVKSFVGSASGAWAVGAARHAACSVVGAEEVWDGTAKPGSETCCFIVPIIPCRQYGKGADSRPDPKNFALSAWQAGPPAQ